MFVLIFLGHPPFGLSFIYSTTAARGPKQTLNFNFY